MNLKDYILLWNHALIEIIDIRHTSQHYSDIYSLNVQLDYIVNALLAAPRVK